MSKTAKARNATSGSPFDIDALWALDRIGEPSLSPDGAQAVASVTSDMPASAAMAAKRAVEASDLSLTKRRAIVCWREPSMAM